jgi:general secretion pathway protein C
MSWRQRLQKPAFWLAALRWVLPLILVVILAALLADTVWLWAYGPSDVVPRNPELPRVEEQASGAETEQVRYEAVREWALFGTWEKSRTEDSKDKPVDAPETRLQLKLLGVFQTGAKGQEPGAIVAEQGNNGKLYRVGDRLPGNARLHEVYADRVILRRQGQLETLKLESPGLTGGVRPVDESAGAQRSSEERDRPRPSQDQNADGSGLAGSVEQQRQRIIRGLGLESSDQGYVIGDAAPAQLLDRAGLKPGDVVVSVNGHDVGQKKADLAALKEYHDEGSAKVVIERGSQRFTVTVPP